MKQFKRFLVILLIGVCLFKSTFSARILASVSTAAYSHQVAFRPIWKELANRGHEIILMTTDPMKETKNIRQIDMSFSYTIMKERNFSSIITNDLQKGDSNSTKLLYDIFFDYIFKQIEHPEVQQIINNKSEHFDLFMVEVMFPIHLGLLEKIKAPVIALSSMDASQDIHSSMGNGVHPVLYPESVMIAESFPMSLQNRIMSAIGVLFLQIFNKWFILPSLVDRMKEAFGENCRSFEELYEEIDMLFINTNHIFHNIRPLQPNTISFGGGTHVQYSKKPLPEDLKNFMDNANEGIIYFSLGSNIKGSLLSDNLQQVFVDTFAELPYKVLWKFENENITLKSNNVMIRQWIPQSTVLGHTNIKLFITQCGLQSIDEAISNHIPMIGIPFIGDQAANARKLKKNGLGLMLEYSTLTKQIFKESILEVINNNRYKERVIEVADLMTDVEMAGIEKAIWWTEYVIRNKGAKHLKYPISNIPFYQLYLLDVFLVIMISLLILLYSIKSAVFLVLRICSPKNKKE